MELRFTINICEVIHLTGYFDSLISFYQRHISCNLDFQIFLYHTKKNYRQSVSSTLYRNKKTIQNEKIEDQEHFLLLLVE